MIDVRALGYAVVEATHVDAWRRYAEDVPGMQALDTYVGTAVRGRKGSQGGVRLRVASAVATDAVGAAIRKANLGCHLTAKS
ncbi:hypothetical protein [Burkholderia sp. BCC0322]|uniref:hypothetical protein n=1 Tax=unclassified Burkholderia TaxID=2613784 RepID=UPI001FC7C46C|nr:hypothetical protein [Burkholderia sp. BCC0322]